MEKYESVLKFKKYIVDEIFFKRNDEYELKEEGVPPCTLIDFYPKDFLLVIDESHVSIPQVRAMYNRRPLT